MNNMYSGSPTREVIDMGQTSTFFNKFITEVYSFMTLGLLVTAVTSFAVTTLSAYSQSFSDFFVAITPLVFILELVVVIVLSFMWKRFTGFVALGLFMFYAVLNGLFFGIILQYYTLTSIAFAFGATFLTFGIMSLYGYFTKSDLTKWGNLALMALIGVIIGTIVNIFVASDALGWLLTYIGLGVFIIFVAVDTQKLKRLSYGAENSGGSALNYATQGALILYLDFINIFIRILGISGKRR